MKFLFPLAAAIVIAGCAGQGGGAAQRPEPAVEYKAGVTDKWYTSLDEAREEAKKSGRLLLVDFNAVWCGPCQQYKKEVFPTEDFKQRSENFVFVEIDVDKDPELAKQFNISAIPDIRLLTHDGAEVGRVLGYTGEGLMAHMDDAVAKVR